MVTTFEPQDSRLLKKKSYRNLLLWLVVATTVFLFVELIFVVHVGFDTLDFIREENAQLIFKLCILCDSKTVCLYYCM